MQKFRISCPHCQASLLVTEDLLGQPGTCPGCHAGFQLPTVAALTATKLEPLKVQGVQPWGATSEETASNVRELPAASTPVSMEFTSESRPKSNADKLQPVRIESRPMLRIIASLMKVVAVLQILAACLILIVLLVAALGTVLPPMTVLWTIAAALLTALGALPTLAVSEMILVFLAQEELLRHILNHMRSRD